VPNGQLYACPVTIDAGAAPGSYELSNAPSAAVAPYYGITGVSGDVGHIAVTTCTGDCDANGTVSIGEIVKCVNMFLGAPLCDPQDASRSSLPSRSVKWCSASTASSTAAEPDHAIQTTGSRSIL